MVPKKKIMYYMICGYQVVKKRVVVKKYLLSTLRTQIIRPA